jgi:hypothetical protein
MGLQAHEIHIGTRDGICSIVRQASGMLSNHQVNRARNDVDSAVDKRDRFAHLISSHRDSARRLLYIINTHARGTNHISASCRHHCPSAKPTYTVIETITQQNVCRN